MTNFVNGLCYSLSTQSKLNIRNPRILSYELTQLVQNPRWKQTTSKVSSHGVGRSSHFHNTLRAQVTDEEGTQPKDKFDNIIHDNNKTSPVVNNDIIPVDKDNSYVLIAEITNTHGVRGEVRVRPLTDFPEERLETAGRRYIRRGERGVVEPVKLTRGRSSVSRGHNVHILKFQGVNNPEEARAQLVGCNLLVSSTDRPALDDENLGFEFYVQDLVGVTALHKDGSTIGKVVDIFGGTGTYDALQVELSSEEYKGSKVLIPFAREIVTSVDLEKKQMIVDPPAGLLELAKKAGLKKKGRDPKKANRRGDVKRLQELREKKKLQESTN
mmetsp:Transcript_20141/g.27886  ORF Transcript_20141/g.27886 Transcript_20141/m.27886 type:complete len:327 (-) Transcript_20141:239-1219(-)